MGITDVIKKSVLEGFSAANLPTASIAVTLGIALAMGLYIYFIYRTTTNGGFYNRSFNKSLAAMPVITAGILLAMQSNLIISLGMVGALSIVRFRNAVKDSSDLTYLFWSISVGIIVGTGLYELAIILSLAVTVLIFGLDLIPASRSSWMLVISCSSEADDDKITETVKKYSPKARLRSHNISSFGSEWIFELMVKDDKGLLRDVSELEGVKTANLMSHDGDVRY